MKREENYRTKLKDGKALRLLWTETLAALLRKHLNMLLFDQFLQPWLARSLLVESKMSTSSLHLFMRARIAIQKQKRGSLSYRVDRFLSF